MKNAITVTTLIENDSSDLAQFVAEHGLSLHIAYNGQNILFDTGATGDFIENAEKLNVDLAKVDLVIISHSHYDHTGGLARFFEQNTSAPVYMHRLARNGYYSRRENEVTSIGLEKSVYQANADRFIFINQRAEISDSLTLVTEYDRQYPVPQSPTLLKKEKGELVVDDFQHEIMLILHQADDMIVFTGCSHNGILNMVAAARKVFPEKKIQAVLGGFHLSSRHS
ncbi:MBL fold metallo-hydrolase, partial [bacterium]|nr:MBL fold metallo-hydrolase [bacterium]